MTADTLALPSKSKRPTNRSAGKQHSKYSADENKPDTTKPPLIHANSVGTSPEQLREQFNDPKQGPSPFITHTSNNYHDNLTESSSDEGPSPAALPRWFNAKTAPAPRQAHTQPTEDLSFGAQPMSPTGGAKTKEIFDRLQEFQDHIPRHFRSPGKNAPSNLPSWNKSMSHNPYNNKKMTKIKPNAMLNDDSADRSAFKWTEFPGGSNKRRRRTNDRDRSKSRTRRTSRRGTSKSRRNTEKSNISSATSALNGKRGLRSVRGETHLYDSEEGGIVPPVPHGICQQIAAKIMFWRYYMLIYFFMIGLLISMTVYDLASDPLLRVDPPWFIAMNIVMVVLLGIEILCRVCALQLWDWSHGFGCKDMLVLTLVVVILSLYWAAPDAQIVDGKDNTAAYAFLLLKNLTNLFCVGYILKRSWQVRTLYASTLKMTSIDLNIVVDEGSMSSQDPLDRDRLDTYNTFLSFNQDEPGNPYLRKKKSTNVSRGSAVSVTKTKDLGANAKYFVEEELSLTGEAGYNRDVVSTPIAEVIEERAPKRSDVSANSDIFHTSIVTHIVEEAPSPEVIGHTRVRTSENLLLFFV